MKKRALLLDLDGTLLDTAPDLAAALNALLQEEQRAPLPYEHIRPVVSHGGMALVQLGFHDVTSTEHTHLYQRLLTLYRNALALGTKLFTGFERVFTHLCSHEIPWGIVTNKPGWLTDPLLDTLNITRHTACVVSGDTLAERKPHPLPLLHAAHLLKVNPAECIYVGDAERDIQAGRAAGMLSLVALWGYFRTEDKPEHWQADGLVNAPHELIPWLTHQ